MKLYLLFGYLMIRAETSIIPYSQCPTGKQYDFDHSECVFYYGLFGPNCTQLSLSSCTWQYCSDTDYENRCISYSTAQQTDWKSCTNACCDSSVDYPSSQGSLGQCQDYINKQYSILVAIIVSCTVGPFLILLIIFCACFNRGRLKDCCRKCCDSCRKCCTCLSQFWTHCLNCRCFRPKMVNQQIRNPETENRIYIEPLRGQCWVKNWDNQSYMETCIVCLDVGPTLQLQCGHNFHKQCLIAWVDKKEECILCRSTEINQIRLYCQICYKSYYTTTLRQNKHKLMTSIQNCDECLDRQIKFKREHENDR